MLHWPPTGRYDQTAVGTSFHEESVRTIAGNDEGEPALVFCTASLVLEPGNPHDNNAVSVIINAERVGYLSRDCASRVRQSFIDNGLEAEATTCDAAITNGFVSAGRTYSHTIELDFDLSFLPQPMAPSFPVIERRPVPQFKIFPDGTLRADVRLPPHALTRLDPKLRIMRWTTDNWDTVNYYVRNNQGIGLGHKLLEVPKDVHASLVGPTTNGPASATLEKLCGRIGVLVLHPTS